MHASATTTESQSWQENSLGLLWMNVVVAEMQGIQIMYK